MPPIQPEVLNYLANVRAIADFDVPAHVVPVFSGFHSWITNPQPESITALCEHPKGDRWYRGLVNGVLGDVRNGLAAAHYHASNIAQIEHAVCELLADPALLAALRPGQGIGVGGTRKLDYEYQAFVLAFRRCLDYLAQSLSAYFKTQQSSFRSWPTALRRQKNSVLVSKALLAAHDRHADKFGFVLDADKSVRSRIAHFEAVPAGVLNLHRMGAFLAGGGENLRMDKVEDDQSLSQVTASRLLSLEKCIQDFVESFIVSALENELDNPAP